MDLKEFLEKLAIALELTKDEIITFDTQLSEIWDSLGQIGVLSMLEEEYKVLLTMDELVMIKSVKDIVDALKSRGVDLK